MNKHFLNNMKRPIVFFDLETTGLDPMHDRICQYSFQKMELSGDITGFSGLINPGIPIPLNAIAVHGITDEMVSDKQSFREMAPTILSFIDGCDFAGFNIMQYDIPLLIEEFGRVNIGLNFTDVNIIDVCLIYKKLRPRNLMAAFKEYIGYEFEGAHGADADTSATIDVLTAMIEKESEIGKSPESLMNFTIDKDNMVDIAGKFKWNPMGEMIFNFGPQNGNRVIDNMGMLKWMIGKNFSRDTMKWVYLVQSDPSAAYKKMESHHDDFPFDMEM